MSSIRWLLSPNGLGSIGTLRLIPLAAMLRSNQSSDVAGKETQKTASDARSRGPQSTSARLQSAELADSGQDYAERDQVSVVVTLLMADRPDGEALVAAILPCEPEQMNHVTQSLALMDTLVAACTEAQLALALPHLFSDPMWALYYYVCEKGAEDLSTIQAFIAQASTSQRQNILEWRALGQRLEALFGDEDPAALFGEALTTQVARSPGVAASAAPWFSMWCLRHVDRDIDLWLEAVATSPDTVDAALSDERGQWAEFMASSPRGAELSQRAQAALDRIALRFSDVMPLEALLDAFAVRFDEDLRELAVGAGIELDHDGVRALWAALAPLPAHGVDADVIRWAAGGDQFDAELEARLEPDEGDDEETPSGHPGGRGPTAPRSEANEGPAHWRRFDAVTMAVDAFVEHAGGDDPLREAAMEFLLGGGGDALRRWRAAVHEADARGALSASPAQVEIALVRLRDALPHDANFEGRGGEDGRPDLTAPTAFAGWTDYFAAVVSCATGGPGPTSRAPRLPSWLPAAEQGGLIEGE